MSFIFEDIDNKTGHGLKLGEFWYYFDLPKILFKTKYKLERIKNTRPFIIKSRKYTYVIDFLGEILFRTTQDKLEQKLKEWNLTYNWSYQKENPPFDVAKYEFIFSPFNWNNKKIYLVKKSGKRGLIDEKENIIIDFKYNDFYPFQFSDDNTPYFAAKDTKTNLAGVIDINEKVIIPFMYDMIHEWNIETGRKTIQVAKNNICGLIDINNNILLDFKYQYIFGFAEDEYSFAMDENDKWGVINRQGKEIEFDTENVKELKLRGKLL